MPAAGTTLGRYKILAPLVGGDWVLPTGRAIRTQVEDVYARFVADREA